MGEGVVPGNRNLDNVDPRLRPFDTLCFPHETAPADGGLRAALLTSFGFGQVRSRPPNNHNHTFDRHASHCESRITPDCFVVLTACCLSTASDKPPPPPRQTY